MEFKKCIGCYLRDKNGDCRLLRHPDRACHDIRLAYQIGGSDERYDPWIPCSERLPKADACPMDCMVTRESQYIGNYVDIAVCESDGTWTHEDWDAIVVGDVESGRKTGLISTRDDEIVAWMPLPEAYKGGK